jgi:regulator of sigma E protease
VAAKVFKTRVEKFYLFFNPWFALFKFKKGETEYGIGWLPLGGYVKISGMIDESMDKEQMKLPPEPHEFRSKPAWQRLIIMLGGVTVNVILAAAIYMVMLMVWGEQYLPTTEANKFGITCDSIALEMGLQDGDKILSIDNEVVEEFSKIPLSIILNEAKTVQIMRNNVKQDVNIPEGFIGKFIKQKKANFINIRFPFEVSSFTKNSTAAKAGMEVGDKVIEVNGKSMIYFNEIFNEVTQHPNEEVSIKVIRNNETIALNVTLNDAGKFGAYPMPLDTYFNFSDKSYSVVEAIPQGFVKAYEGIGDYLKQLKLIFSPEVKAYESVGGFITIGSIFPKTWDWHSFWRLTALLSIMLAIINVLPIPALDGGHTMFLLYEMVSGRKPNDKFMEYAQLVGMIILFSLLIFANGNDIVKLFK